MGKKKGSAKPSNETPSSKTVASERVKPNASDKEGKSFDPLSEDYILS